MTKSKLHVCVFVLAIIASIFLSLTSFIVYRRIDDKDYSLDTKRAWMTLEQITAEPHPAGSEFNAAVRENIYKMLKNTGIKTEVLTDTFEASENETIPISNIWGDLETGGGSSVLFVAHYDSEDTTYGAGDNGELVAALAEAARTFKENAKTGQFPTNIKILFTDGEELGLAGAELFIQNHSDLLDDTIFVVNLDAYGHGPFMLAQGSVNKDFFNEISYVSGVPAISATVESDLMSDLIPFLHNGFNGITAGTLMGNERVGFTENNGIGDITVNTFNQCIYSVYDMMVNISQLSSTAILEKTYKDSGVAFPLFNNIYIKYPKPVGILLSFITLIANIAFVITKKLASVTVKNAMRIIFETLILIFSYLIILMLLFIVSGFILPTKAMQVYLGFMMFILPVFPSIIVWNKFRRTKSLKSTKTIWMFLFSIVGLILSFLNHNIAYLVYIPVFLFLLGTLLAETVSKFYVFFTQIIIGVLFFPLIILLEVSIILSLSLPFLYISFMMLTIINMDAFIHTLKREEPAVISM